MFLRWRVDFIFVSIFICFHKKQLASLFYDAEAEAKEQRQREEREAEEAAKKAYVFNFLII